MKEMIDSETRKNERQLARTRPKEADGGGRQQIVLHDRKAAEAHARELMAMSLLASWRRKKKSTIKSVQVPKCMLITGTIGRKPAS